MTETERALAAAFHQAAMRQRRCAVCRVTRNLEADHALPVQAIKRLVGDWRMLGAAWPGVRWDVRNARALCGLCHVRWTRRLIPPPPVGEAVWEFARELDERFGRGAEPFTAYLEGCAPAREAA